MRTITLEEVNKMGDGEPITAVEGTIAAVYERRTGHHDQYGDWSMQNATLVDGDHKETVTFKNREDMSDWKGAKVRLESFKGKKGMAGLVMSVKQDGDKTYRSINCTVDPVKAHPNTKSEGSKPPKNTLTKKDVDEYIEKLGKLRWACEEEAAKVVKNMYGDGFSWDDPHQSEKATTIASSLFIQATKKFTL